MGLAIEYMHDEGTYMRKLLCLPFLPSEHIRPTFEALCDLKSADHLTPLLNYLANKWVNSRPWPVEGWSVYGQSVRTNNDVEGMYILYNIIIPILRFVS